jgi:hypothetical protein
MLPNAHKIHELGEPHYTVPCCNSFGPASGSRERQNLERPRAFLKRHGVAIVQEVFVAAPSGIAAKLLLLNDIATFV